VAAKINMLFPNPQIFHHHKCIFIHIPKTAGTAIENTLKEKSSIVGGHSYAASIQAKYPEIFREYYKFTFIRNPINRFVSEYYYLKNSPCSNALSNKEIIASKNINEYVQSCTLLPNILHLREQHVFICNRDMDILVDDVYRYENIENDWQKVRIHKLGLDYEPLMVMNKTKEKHTNLTKENEEIVSKWYHKDFELFNY
jgi:hypothetical protein